jgi:hypothetical protein
MKNAVGNVIISNKVEHLGLIYVPGIGERVKNPIAIDRKIFPVAVCDLRFLSSANNLTAEGRIWRKSFSLQKTKTLFNVVQNLGPRSSVLSHQ